ncbi:MAG: type II toxin-antitoxin system RelE/ParE family toxin [Spirochaetaceae bacterium]|nr:type II toxin-antitoxin system RelE/ParE family toxin [Spirochaetaceae bacterium]
MVNQLEAGQSGANLGGGVYKQRIARPGAGKSGGYRVIVYVIRERSDKEIT